MFGSGIRRSGFRPAQLLVVIALSTVSSTVLTAARYPDGVDSKDELVQLGMLDVTKAPYFADPTGQKDATQAIQRAVNDARDHWLACFFPEGTYLISDTLSCEQRVEKLDRPRSTDSNTQHYWDLPNRIVMIGSTKGQRPTLKLSPDARGFDDPNHPKLAVWVWAQTRNDAPGKQEPAWGVEQPNISFSHVFNGIDIDIRDHAGAIGIRHSGSQGSTLQNVTVLADGAYAGLSNCCGQGGGTYNVEVIGGRYGIMIDRGSRFPLLVSSVFREQTDASVLFTQPNQMPTLMVGCRLQPASSNAIEFSSQGSGAGVSLVDCLVDLTQGGSICRTRQAENVFLENVFVRGATAVCSGASARFPVQPPGESPHSSWYRMVQHSEAIGRSTRLINGVETSEIVSVVEPVDTLPDFESLRASHFVPSPSFEDIDVVSVKSFGAKGDGIHDDTAAFEKAIAASDKVFVPAGKFHLTGQLRLKANTKLFGIPGRISSIGNQLSNRRDRSQRMSDATEFSIVTAGSVDAAPEVAFLSVNGRIEWNSGKGVLMLAPAQMLVSSNGGGRIYGAMARGGPMVFKGTKQPLAFYALNVERVAQDPQSTFDQCSNVRIYFFKVEAGTLNREDRPDANTPSRIVNCSDLRVYCMYGVVRHLNDRPMIEVIDSQDVQISQLQTFSPGEFPHLVELNHGTRHVVPSQIACALFVRNASNAGHGTTAIPQVQEEANSKAPVPQ